MLAPVSWLKEYVKIPGSIEKVAESLLLSGTKVEEIKKEGKESILNLEITPNRPDTLSIYGVAREIAAVTKQDILPLNTELLLPRQGLKTSPNLKIVDKKLCPFYTYGIIENIAIGPSPTWLEERLKQVGIRPVNNVVDITNYVMHETGQPMHAFDFDKVEGELTLRAAKEGEVVKTLDGIQRKLQAGTIIIEDSKKLIDLAGIMGGENSEIDTKTKRIFLHVPIYDPVAIRRTSQYLGLRTEASNRFEKKLDPRGHLQAFERAAKLLNELSGASIATEPKSLSPDEGPSLSFNLEEVFQVLGIEAKLSEVINILSSLGFQVSEDPFKENVLKVIIPSWRTDIEEGIDIAEEIGRIWLYNRFPKTLPTGEVPQHPDSFDFDWEAFTENEFKAAGFTQTMTYTLSSAKRLQQAKINPNETLKVANPMSEDFEYLRPSLIPELLSAVEKNQRTVKEISFFEVGRVFAQGDDLPKQPRILSFVTNKTFSETKGVVEFILEKTGVVEERLSTDSLLTSKMSFSKGKTLLAEIGEIESDILNNFEISSKIVAGTIFLDDLVKEIFSFNYKPLAKFPSIIEDLSMFVDVETPIQAILKIVKNNSLVEEVEVFDIFEERGRKSIAVRITYQAKDRTLTDKEVSKVRETISKKLEKVLNAKIRRS